MSYKAWEVGKPDTQLALALAKKLNIGTLLANILIYKGYTEEQQAKDFLENNTDISDAFLLDDINKAVERIHLAIEQEEMIVIFGDYDVDGVTATALLYTYLQSVGANVYYKLPNREDGYGLIETVVDNMADLGAQLIITVDNGISALPAALQAQKREVDLIITDHHLPPAELPPALAIVNPQKQSDTSPFKKLAGVGVAFKLVAALEGVLPEELLPEFSDLVAVGTIADIMPIVQENRRIVAAGLDMLIHAQRIGFDALLQVCGIDNRQITADRISFGIAPYINAAGRMGDATLALKLLLTDDEQEANEYALALQAENIQRQTIEKEIQQQVIDEIEKNPALLNNPVLVLWGDNWHNGVIGIVASRILERYGKPVILVSFDGDEGRASGRSIHGFSLYSAIDACKDLLIQYGGHDLAAGLSIKKENIELFRTSINDWAKKHVSTLSPPPKQVDMSVDFLELTVKNIKELSYLEPYGSGNHAPLFMVQGVQVDGLYAIGGGKHTSVRLRQQNKTIYAVMFGKTLADFPFKKGDSIDVLLSLSIFEGKAGEQVSAHLIDYRPVGLTNIHVQQALLFENYRAGVELSKEEKELLFPTRELIEKVYIAIKKMPELVLYHDLRFLFAKLGEENTGKILVALATLEELGLIVKNPKTGYYNIIQTSTKKDLNTSKVLYSLGVL